MFPSIYPVGCAPLLISTLPVYPSHTPTTLRNGSSMATDAATKLRAMRSAIGENDMMAYIAMRAARLAVSSATASY